MRWGPSQDFLNLLQAIAAVATAVGVGLAWWQVRKSAIAARTDFEDELDREYRELTRELPSEALLGKELTEPAQADALPHFLNYIDLCNQQIFLRENGRVGKKTWEYWRDGIRSNLARPSFRRAWEEIKAETDNFAELRRLENNNFEDDPRFWKDLANQSRSA